MLPAHKCARFESVAARIEDASNLCSVFLNAAQGESAVDKALRAMGSKREESKRDTTMPSAFQQADSFGR